MIDGHTHLENGPLTPDYCMEFIEAAVAKGIDTLHILDHTHRFIEFAPMYEPLKKADPRQKAWFEFGLEVCYAPRDKAFLKDLLQQYPYDFLIGSIHSIDGLLYDMEAFSREILWDKYDTNAIYQRYYEIMEDMICSGLFTQIGHPDQLKLFHYTPTMDMTPIYERIAALAKRYHVQMENNTGIYYRYHHEDMGTNAAFLNILKQHGVDIITASDAHRSEHVGMYIKEISE